MTIKFTPTTTEDIPQLQEWIAADPWHQGQTPEFWLTGAPNSLLAFCLQDDRGPVLYARVDQGDPATLHTQFAPVEVVSKGRLVRGMLKAMPVLFNHVKTKASAIVFESVSPTLIVFMLRAGFVRVEDTDDYNLEFAPSAEESEDAIEVE